MHQDELNGIVKEVEGKIQEKVAVVLDNPEQQKKGIDKQIEGQIQQVTGQVKEALHKAID